MNANVDEPELANSEERSRLPTAAVRSVGVLSRNLLLAATVAGAPAVNAQDPLHAMPNADRPDRPFAIQVVDEATGRGVPLVTLETVHHLRFVTDNAGRVAFHEPGLLGQEVFFFVRSPGYEFPKDGFGYDGTRLNTVAGGQAVLRIKRVNVAERLYRITGEGLYGDTVLLGLEAPLRQPLGAGRVAGQDSVQAVPYRDRVYWFWGDTARLSYPLGHFWTAGATSRLPSKGGLDPAVGVDLEYFTGPDRFSRPMARLGVDRGLIWIDGLLTVPDAQGRDRMVAHYSHVESLGKDLGHGLAVYQDATEQFERLSELALTERWRFPRSHPVRGRAGDAGYYYFGDPLPNVRVPARFEALSDPAAYEAWTCVADANTPGTTNVLRSADGRLAYRWTREDPPLTGAVEKALIAAGLLKPDEAAYRPVDVDSGKPVEIHGGTVRWNNYRQRWVLIGVQQGGDASYLGEVWYAEARAVTGPWRRAKKIATHPRYSFYNPAHHDFFDQAGGRLIYFEGTYVNTFSGNPETTPRYDYNQLMYQLDLAGKGVSPHY